MVGLEIDDEALMLLVLPVGLETDDDLMLVEVLHDGGERTLLMLWGLEMGERITLRGLVSGGDPTVLEPAGLQVAEFLLWTWLWARAGPAALCWLTRLLMVEQANGPPKQVGLVVDETRLLLPPGLEMELGVWGLQDRDKPKTADPAGVPDEQQSPGVELGCFGNPVEGDFNLGLPADAAHWLSSRQGRPQTPAGYIFPGLQWPPCWPKPPKSVASLAAFIYKPMDSATVLDSSLESIISGFLPWRELLKRGRTKGWCWFWVSLRVGCCSGFFFSSLLLLLSLLSAVLLLGEQLTLTMSIRTSLLLFRFRLSASSAPLQQ